MYCMLVKTATYLLLGNWTLIMLCFLSVFIFIHFKLNLWSVSTFVRMFSCSLLCLLQLFDHHFLLHQHSQQCGNGIRDKGSKTLLRWACRTSHYNDFYQSRSTSSSQRKEIISSLRQKLQLCFLSLAPHMPALRCWQLLIDKAWCNYHYNKSFRSLIHLNHSTWINAALHLLWFWFNCQAPSRDDSWFWLST